MTSLVRWRLASERVADRLVALGRRGVGGFVEAGRDDDGVYADRAPGEPTLAAWLVGQNALPFREATTRAASLAAALAACEEASLFPGPLGPAAVIVRDDGAELRADPLVAAITGTPAPAASSSAEWMAPELSAGAPVVSNAANRYVLGLILYRLLAGEHAFAGRGLRLALDEQAQRGAPPFRDEVARGLPPGLQGFCLRLLDPSPTARPSSAREIEQSLREFLDGSEVEHRRLPVAGCLSPVAPSAPASAPAQTRARLRPALLGLIPILVGIVGAVAAARAIDPAAPARPPGVRERAQLAATTVDNCASCHPRQSAEWKRSVMAHSVKSPLFLALEALIEEQVGKDADCPEGAGILREADPASACRDRVSGLPVTGSGGALWCVNCHAPGENLGAVMPAWDGRPFSSPSRRPLRDLLPAATMEGISCAFCHQVEAPTRPGHLERGLYEGNPFWTSTATGERFPMRPEDRFGLFGIANSGYFLDPKTFEGRDVLGAHGRPSDETRRYLASSEFCGSCHDVRLFGSDALSGEHFKRLRNAYSEWRGWADGERRAGREPASCQSCHMSLYPGVCAPGAPSLVGTRRSLAERICPDGTRFEPRPPGAFPTGHAATSAAPTKLHTHSFSGVDLPFAREFDAAFVDDPTLDVSGVPRGARQRRDLLLAGTFRFDVLLPHVAGDQLVVPVEVENIGAGHRVPAGFSQEREFWVHVRVTDANGLVVYEVGRVDRNDEDLRDKVFLNVNVADDLVDGLGRPLGVFGADVADGPDVPVWDPSPSTGARDFRGRGLINFQNGFLRCVRCIGVIDADGRCQPGPGQGLTRADRFADGDFDPDTGECRSNLVGANALFETYFPVGALDAERGITKGPDAIIDTRSLPAGGAVRYTYELPLAGRRGPFTVEARLLFRAFPPYLVKAFAAYEARQAARGLRPSGPMVTPEMLDRLEVVEIAAVKLEVP